MKHRTWEPQNLSNAFTPLPQDVRDALMNTVGSVKEEPQVKRITLRTVLIAALALLLMTTVALAASELLGISDFFEDFYGVQVPQGAQDAMPLQQPMSFEVGEATFSVQELICDGHLALCSTAVRMTDGSEALFVMDAADCIGTEQMERLDLSLPEGATWLEAAQALDRPLYLVRALIEPQNGAVEAEMEDLYYQADGTPLYVSMPLLESASVTDEELSVNFYFSLTAVDLETGDTLKDGRWTSNEHTASLSICPLLEEKTYRPAQASEIAGFAVGEITARRYATGVYTSLALTAGEGMKQEDVSALHEAMFKLRLLDGEGQPLPDGISLSSGIDEGGFPQVQVEHMFSLEALPESLILSYGDDQISMR